MGTGFKSKLTASRARGQEGNKQPSPGNALYTQGRKASMHSEGLNHLSICPSQTVHRAQDPTSGAAPFILGSSF